MGDALFPIGEPTFMWVHDLIVHDQSASATAGSDDRGRPIEPTHVPGQKLRGYVGAGDKRQINLAGGAAERVDAVARVPLSTQVRFTGLLEVPAQSGLRPGLAGLYEVDAVRPTAADIRLLLHRVR